MTTDQREVVEEVARTIRENSDCAPPNQGSGKRVKKRATHGAHKRLMIDYIKGGEGVFVPKDQLMAHFTDASVPTCSRARTTLTSDGYTFEKVDNGWLATPPPKPVVEAETGNKLTRDEMIDKIVDLLETGIW